MLPFSVSFRTGIPVYEQVIYAVKKAMISGQLATGDKFPSVRSLGQELRINPNTAHKVVASLVKDGLLEVKPGIGTVVAEGNPPDRRQRKQLLGADVERLAVEAKRLSLNLDDVVDAIKLQWTRLDKENP